MARLLVVDDDPAQLKMRRLMLESAGHQAQIAATVSDALRLLPAVEPDILLMDLRVPELRDGLELIRAADQRHKPTRIVVLSGWPEDLQHLPEQKLVHRVVSKTMRPAALLRLISELAALFWLLLSISEGLCAETFPFSLARGCEVVAEIEMSSPGSDWSKPGREAVLADLVVDGSSAQNIMLYAGEDRHTYAAFLGALPPGQHQLRLERNARYSARATELKVWNARFQEVPSSDPAWIALAHAPILYARADTIGQFTDIPLIAYCERLSEEGRPYLQYTMIFSNEDGGTPTRALMARWGRTTDIEYIYRAWLDARGGVERATIQARNHEEVPFRGKREGSHPVLIPSTRNNMVADRGSSVIRYQIPPVPADLTAHSREQIMDDRPFCYRVMAQELEREGKLRPFGVVDGEKVGDPRNYLYIEAKAAHRDSALAALVRLRGESVWRSSSLGRADYAIPRDGWFRTAIELPPGTTAGRIGEIGFECTVKPSQKELTAGVCRLEAVSKVFLLTKDYSPGPSLWSRSEPTEIPTGQIRTFEWRGL